MLASRLLSHRSKAYLVPVLTRSTSGPLEGTRPMKTDGGSRDSLRDPSADTSITLEAWGEGVTKVKAEETGPPDPPDPDSD